MPNPWVLLRCEQLTPVSKNNRRKGWRRSRKVEAG
jgi:hypothetical protein